MGTCKDEKVLCALPPAPHQVLYSMEATKGKRQGRCPGMDPRSRLGFPGSRRKGGSALRLGLLPKQTAIWGRPHPRHRPLRIRVHPLLEE